jgi:cell division septation protein DedD
MRPPFEKIQPADRRATNCCERLTLHFPTNLKSSPRALVPPKFGASFRFHHVWDRCGFGAGVRYELVLRSQSAVRPLLTSTVVAAAIALAGCTSDGMPASTGNSGSIGSFVRNLFGSKSEDETPVTHDEAPVEPSAPKIKSATSKPKTVAAAPPAKLRSRQPTTKTVTEPKPSPKRQASVQPQSPPESPTPPLLSGAAPTLPTGSFDNRVGSRR